MTEQSKPTWCQRHPWFNRHLWPKRAIAIFVMLLTLYPVYWYFQVTTQPITVRSHQHMERQYTSIGTVVTIVINLRTNLLVNFTAKGSISVNNPVTVSGIAYETTPNITGFCLGFTDAYNASNTAEFSCLLFKPFRGNMYLAEGKLVWLAEGPTWPIIAPQNTAPLTRNQTQVGDPSIYISGVSDTLSITSSENNERLTWVLVAFSFLSLQFLIEALLVDDRKEKVAQAPTKNKASTLPNLKSWKSQWERRQARSAERNQSPQQ